MKSLGILLQETYYQDNSAIEMINMSKEDSGLPVIVWILGEISVCHNLPRIKFQNNYANKVQIQNLISLTISDNPQVLDKNIKIEISSNDFEKIRKWVIMNRNLLMKYWKHEIFVDEFLKSIKQV